MSGAAAGSRGRFPGFDPLGQAGHWDRVTAEVVRDRAGSVPVTKFFTGTEEACARALLSLLTGQRGPDGDLTVPVLEMVDAGHAMPGRNPVRARNESASLLPNDGTRTNHQLRRDMRRFADEDEIDLVIVGCGAGGSVLAQRMARAGWKVAALDAGPFWDPDTDWQPGRRST